jgi:hypothetical protein
MPMFKQPPPQNGSDDKAEEPKDSERNKKGDNERIKGLCMNCDNRFECLLPRPEGGVWHCEEYR